LHKPFSADLFAGFSPVKALPKPVGRAADMVATRRWHKDRNCAPNWHYAA